MLKHFWYQLLDKEGVELENANIYIYKAGLLDELIIYDTQEQIINQPIVSSDKGIFEFFIKDQFESFNGYSPEQKMKISWDTVGANGEIDNIEIFNQIFQFEDFGEHDHRPYDYSYKNKSMNNLLVYNLENHIISVSPNEYNLHNILPVNITDSNDNTYNKSVSNDLLYDLLSLLASASCPTITASGGIARDYDITSWNTSGDIYYKDFNHGLQQLYPLVQIYDDLNKSIFKPYVIKPIDDENIRIWVLDDVSSHLTLIG